MKQFCLCSLLIIAAAVQIQARPTVQGIPAPADNSIEQALPVNLFDDVVTPKVEPEVEKPAEVEVAEAKPVSAYGAAYSDYQVNGKLIAYIGASWCPHCPKAKAEFEKRAEGRSDCVVLDIDKDAEAKEIMDGYRSVPVIFVFGTVDGKQTKRRYSASKQDLDAIFAKQGQASFAPECLSCGCQSCPRDCAANGCNCSSSSNSSSGGESCGVGLVRGQPVRNVVRLGIGAAKWVKEHKPVRSFCRRLCGRCR